MARQKRARSCKEFQLTYKRMRYALAFGVATSCLNTSVKLGEYDAMDGHARLRCTRTIVT